MTTIESPAAIPSNRRQALRYGLDLPLVLAVITLVCFGLLMVYSASWQFSMDMEKDPSYMVIRQIVWVFVGGTVAFAASRIDYHKYQKLTILMMVGTILSLFFVLALGNTQLGANRTILFGSIQPSELAKLVTIIYLSFWLYKKRDVLDSLTLGLVPLITILGFTAALVLAQPDISAAITIVFLGGMLFFLAGGKMRTIILLVTGIAVIGSMIALISTTGRTRMADYVSGLQNPVEASYHVQRSIESIVKGGLFGVGIGRASTKFTGLPVAPTDSIFAVIVEETGLLGAGLVVGLYTIILWRGLIIAQNAQDKLGKLLASGLSLWIFLEAVINMGVMVNLLPFAGNALPLVSAGGSSLTTTLAAVGVILNVGMLSVSPKKQEGRTYSAIVDLRRRDGRGSLSRSGRFTSTRR
ncbi:MAG: FtsW/RodA/SpoVE family cell cycle protein [Anaerolineaceae bacterium]